MGKMKQNWIVRWLGEVLRAALDTSPHDGNSDGGTRVQLAMLIDVENAVPAQMDEIMSRAERYGEITHRLAFRHAVWRSRLVQPSAACGRPA